MSAYKKRMMGREVGICKGIQKQGMTERTLISSPKTMTGRRKTVDEISKI